jgi:hypothetical protein
MDLTYRRVGSSESGTDRKGSQKIAGKTMGNKGTTMINYAENSLICFENT